MATQSLASLRQENKRLKHIIKQLRQDTQHEATHRQLLTLCFILTAGYIALCLGLFLLSEHYFQQANDVTGQVLLVLADGLVLVSIPVTHVVGMLLHGHTGFRMFQPGRGGPSFVSLQAASWTLYSISILGALAYFAAKTPNHLLGAWATTSLDTMLSSVTHATGLHIHDHGILATLGVFGIIAQVLMVSSLTVYDALPLNARLHHGDEQPEEAAAVINKHRIERARSVEQIMSPVTTIAAATPATWPTDKPTRTSRPRSKSPGRRRSRQERGEEIDLWLSAELAWNDTSLMFDPTAMRDVKLRQSVPFVLFILINSGLILVSAALVLLAPQMPSRKSTSLMYGLSILCMTTGVFLTYGLGGRLTHDRVGWRFFQPFVGGTQFVVLQSVTWSLFAGLVAVQCCLLFGTIYVSTSTVQWLSEHRTVVPFVGLACQVALVLSLKLYKRQAPATATTEHDKFVRDLTEKRLGQLSGYEWVLATILVPVFCNIQVVLLVILIAAFFVPLPMYCTAVWFNWGAAFPVGIPTARLGWSSDMCVDGDGTLTWMPQPIDHTLAGFCEFFTCLAMYSISYSSLQLFGIKGWKKYGTLFTVLAVPISFCVWRYHGETIGDVMKVNFVLFLLYVGVTFYGSPEITGRREWVRFRKWLWFWDLFTNYCGAQMFLSNDMVEYLANNELTSSPATSTSQDPSRRNGGVTRPSRGTSSRKDGATGASRRKDGATSQQEASSRKDGAADPATHQKGVLRTAIVGFHPHGIFPASVLWVSNSLWRRKFPDMTIFPLCASIIHYVPLLRDFVQWSGLRDVSRITVDRMLQNGETPMLVVGGQSEMFLSQSWGKDIAIHRGHRGFVRMAIRHGVPLIPAYSFGEHKLMDCVKFPRVQQVLTKLLSLPLFLPYGRWFLPIVRRVPISICVGAPVFPNQQSDEPTMEEIDELHNRYFAALEQVFEEFKQQCGYGDCTLRWVAQR